jgi:hypothetical protein
MHILRRNPPATARHGRRQPAIPGARKDAREALDRLVVALEEDLRPVRVRVLLVVAVLGRVRVQVGALGDGLKKEGGFGFSRCGGVGFRSGCLLLLRDEGQLDRVKVVVACAAFGEL